MAVQLITVADIKLFKGITSNLNEAKDLDPHILEAQDFELRTFIGESFYLAIEADAPGFSTYGDLFNGTTYTYQGNQYRHEGLRAVLAYHAYARYVSQANVKSTPSGFAAKKMQHSEQLDPRTLNIMISQARSGATSHEKRVEEYLYRHASLYPLWKCSDGGKYKSGVKFRRI